MHQELEAEVCTCKPYCFRLEIKISYCGHCTHCHRISYIIEKYVWMP